MSKYRMTIIAFSEVEVEADTTGEAVQLATEQAIFDDDWNYDVLDGRLFDVDRGCLVMV